MPLADAPAKKKDKKKKKKTEDEEDGWFGDEAVEPKKSKKKSADAVDGTKSTEDELAAAQVEIAALKAAEEPDPAGEASKKKKKKKKGKGVVGTDPTAEFDVPDDEDPTAGDFDIETSARSRRNDDRPMREESNISFC